MSATVFAALVIIGCSLGSALLSHKQRRHQKRLLEEAVQNWEGEGGAVFAEDDEEQNVPHLTIA